MRTPMATRSPSLQLLFESINKAIVAIYKILGFVILGSVVLGLLIYIALNGFYFVYRGWTAPAIVSPSDPRVLDLSAKLAQESALREKLIAEKADLAAKLKISDLTVAVETNHAKHLEMSIGNESATRGKELSRLNALRSRVADTQKRFAVSSQALEDISRKKLSEQYEARLIDQHGFATGSFQLAQMASADLSLEEREASIESEVARIAREMKALKNLSSASKPLLTHDTAKLLYEIEQAQLAIESASASRQAIVAAQESLARALAQYDTLLQNIEGSALLRAVRQKLTVAFVPYENLPNATSGTPVVGCSFGIVICRQVGVVRGALDGEVSARHPLFGHDMRGQMVELSFSAPDWAEEMVLHLGSAPFGF